MVELMRKIAEREAGRIASMELGVVESVRVRESESDASNYECSVVLPSHPDDDGRPMKIEDIPILTDRMGTVTPLYPEDLVLVGFIAGDVSQPVVLGRLYTKEKRVPLHKRGQYIVHFDAKAYTGSREKTSGFGTLTVSFRGGYRVMMDRDEVKVQSFDGKTSLTLSGDKVEMRTEDSTLVIEKKKGLTIETKGELNIRASKDIHIKGAKVYIN